MTNIKRSLNGVQTVDASDDATTPESAVAQFIQRSTYVQGEGIEQTVLDFEDKSDVTNARYVVESENGNPLEYGLRQIDAMSKVVAGKSALGVANFNQLPNITVKTIQKSTAEELIPFVLRTLEMTTPVVEGVRNGRGNALGFSFLSKAIAQELKRGGEIYNKFIADVRASGKSTITEWVNSG